MLAIQRRRKKDSAEPSPRADALFARLVEIAKRHPAPRLGLVVEAVGEDAYDVVAWDEDAPLSDPVGFDGPRRGLKTEDQIVSAFEAWAAAGFPC
jgi:hypothetical protein